MRFVPICWSLALLTCFAPSSSSQAGDAPGPLRFRITLSPALEKTATSGRLFVLLTDAAEPPPILRTGFIPGSTWLAAQEVTSWVPGQTIVFDPDRLAFPHPFSQAAPGTYHVMALLDQNHDYAYAGQDSDDLYGPVVALTDINPSHTAPVALTLDRQTEPGPEYNDTPDVKLVAFQSPLLSKFWRRPIMMRAGVVLPPSYDEKPSRAFPTVYHVHGFGGDYRAAWQSAPGLLKSMRDGKRGEMVHVFLDASFRTGHTEFADSANNGPWGRALTEELIPFLEKTYRLRKEADARFLTGHSSGGWSTLWLQVTYPDFFGGTWSTAPDPVDLRNWTGVNVTPGSTDNVYHTSDGHPRNLVRRDGKDLATIEEFARQEVVQGDQGGQFASFEAVWSPKGRDGRPVPLFDRASGFQNPAVQRAWQAYDIRLILSRHWATLGPKLHGKIHVFVGDADTFHLNESVAYLQAFLTQAGSAAEVEVIPGRDHFTLYSPSPAYPNGLSLRIDQEMQASLKAHEGAKPERSQ